MAPGTKVGTGYLSIEGDFGPLERQLAALSGPLRQKFQALGDDAASGFGKVASGLRDQQRAAEDAEKATRNLTDAESRHQDQLLKTREATLKVTDAESRLAAALAKHGEGSQAAQRAELGLERARINLTRQNDRTVQSEQRVGRAHDDVARSSDRAGRRNDDLGSSVTRLGGAVQNTDRHLRNFGHGIDVVKPAALITGASLAAQGLAAAAGGAIAATAALGPLTGLAAAAGGGLLAAAQGAGVFALASSGITAALKEQLTAHASAGSAAVQGASQEKAAAQAIEAAQESLHNAREQVRSATLRLADANRQEHAAEDDLAGAQRDAKAAQEALTQARAEGQRELEDLHNALIDATFSEQEASIGLERAIERQTAVNADATATDLDRREAALNVAEAQQRLTEATTDRSRTQEKATAADKAGVEGTQAYISAQDQATSASQRVKDSQEQLRDAQRGTREATHDLSEANRDAQRALDAVKTAQNDAGTSAVGATGGVAALSTAFDALPAPAQAFVQQLISLKPKLDDLRATAAAGLFPGASAGLTAATQNFEPLKRVVAETSSVLGGLARDAGNLVGSSAFGKDLETVGGRNAKIIDILGHAGLSLANTLRHIIVAAGPLTMWLTRLVAGWAASAEKSAAAGRESGKLAEFFEHTRQITERLVSIFSSLGRAFFEIGKQARPLGDEIFAAIDKSAGRFADWTKSADGQNQIRKYFEDIKPAIFELGRLAHDLTLSFVRLGGGEQLAPLIEKFRTEMLPVLEKVTSGVGAAFGPVLIDALVSITQLVGKLTAEGGGLTAFISTLGLAAQAFSFLLDNVPGLGGLIGGVLAFAGAAKALTLLTAPLGVALQAMGLAIRGVGMAFTFLAANPVVAVVVGLVALGAALYLAYQHSETFRNIVNDVAHVCEQAGAAIVDALKAAFHWLSPAVEATGGVVSAVFTGIRDVASAVFGEITTIITTFWSVISPIFTAGITALRTVWGAEWDAIKLVVTTITAAIGTVLSVAWAAIKAVATTAWAGIKAAIIDPITSAASWIGARISDMKAGLGIEWGVIKSVASAGWAAIKAAIIDPIGDAAHWVKDKIGDLAGWLGNKWDDMVGTVDKFGDSINQKIVSAFKGAANGVIKFINLIIKAINLIPGIPDIDPIHPLAEGGAVGGSPRAAGDAPPGFAVGGMLPSMSVGPGGRVTRPLAIVGEEAPRHPEFVIPTNPAYRQRALGLYGQLSKELGVPGFGLGGALSNIASGAGNLLSGAAGAVGNAASAVAGVPAQLLSQGASWIINQLPGIGNLPDWIKGTGSHVLEGVTKWIKDKVGGILSALTSAVSSGGGGGNFTGAPADQQQLGSVSYVRSHTLAVTALLDRMFGLSMSSGYRSPAHNAAIGGAPGSHHTLGSPSNPGATDSVGSMAGMNSYISYARQHVAGIVEAMVDNYAGLGYNAHLAFFAKGGALGPQMPAPIFGNSGVMGAPFVGAYANGGVSPADGWAFVHEGERMTPKGADQGNEYRFYMDGKEIDVRVHKIADERDRAAGAEYRAGVL